MQAEIVDQPTAALLRDLKQRGLLDDTPTIKMESSVGFLLRRLEQSIEHRESFWDRDFSSPQAYWSSLDANRKQLLTNLGVTDSRIAVDALDFVSTTSQSHVLHDVDGYKIYAVRWPVMRNLHGEGLYLVPDGKVLANVIAIPDADQSPESLCGLNDEYPAGRPQHHWPMFPSRLNWPESLTRFLFDCLGSLTVRR